MKRTGILMLLSCGLYFSAGAQSAENRTDAKQRKQGVWAERIPALREDPAYILEGSYVNGRKEGVWKKTTEDGDVVAEETYKNGALDGLCKYYYPNGKISAAGRMLAIDLEGQKDTVVTINVTTGEEQLMEVTRKGHSVRHGEWRLYDEDGNMIRETYDKGEISESVMQEKKRSSQTPLPHEAQPARRGSRKE
ncbi:toxin-antitoxin system YwqK family antitoxin [Chitinophaga deserti]|uniref:toxin-antitoxin system YwqK family antitoxin n=1 Tax=Chitinophaga deserti TaxID=2164099 RepID=UPI000D6C521C|nr:hypothetical protein [Chitinophaga deserti]